MIIRFTAVSTANDERNHCETSGQGSMQSKIQFFSSRVRNEEWNPVMPSRPSSFSFCWHLVKCVFATTASCTRTAQAGKEWQKIKLLKKFVGSLLLMAVILPVVFTLLTLFIACSFVTSPLQQALVLFPFHTFFPRWPVDVFHFIIILFVYTCLIIVVFRLVSVCGAIRQS